MEEDYLVIYRRFQEIYVLLDDGDTRALRVAGLSTTQYNLLRRLGDHNGEGLTISELARLLLCTRGNITRLVQRLEQQGLVTRSGDENDQRLVRVTLTPEGRARLTEAQAQHLASLQRRLAWLNLETRQTLLTLTEELVTSLTADLAGEPPPPPEDELELAPTM
jgi:MarR family 2-MHQ and catechol resistance regulon transcriptional repressor